MKHEQTFVAQIEVTLTHPHFIAHHCNCHLVTIVGPRPRGLRTAWHRCKVAAVYAGQLPTLTEITHAQTQRHSNQCTGMCRLVCLCIFGSCSCRSLSPCPRFLAAVRAQRRILHLALTPHPNPASCQPLRCHWHPFVQHLPNLMLRNPDDSSELPLRTADSSELPDRNPNCSELPRRTLLATIFSEAQNRRSRLLHGTRIQLSQE